MLNWRNPKKELPQKELPAAVQSSAVAFMSTAGYIHEAKYQFATRTFKGMQCEFPVSCVRCWIYLHELKDTIPAELDVMPPEDQAVS